MVVSTAVYLVSFSMYLVFHTDIHTWVVADQCFSFLVFSSFALHTVTHFPILHQTCTMQCNVFPSVFRKASPSNPSPSKQSQPTIIALPPFTLHSATTEAFNPWVSKSSYPPLNQSLYCSSLTNHTTPTRIMKSSALVPVIQEFFPYPFALPLSFWKGVHLLCALTCCAAPMGGGLICSPLFQRVACCFYGLFGLFWCSCWLIDFDGMECTPLSYYWLTTRTTVLSSAPLCALPPFYWVCVSCLIALLCPTELSGGKLSC